MTDFMTALPVILVQPTCSGDQRTKGAQLKSNCKLCRERRKTQVWLCFLLLSTLSTACAASLQYGNVLRDLLTCLEELQPALKSSDAMLYTPLNSDIEDRCRQMALKCYMLELAMVATEEEIDDTAVMDCIYDFKDTLPEAEAEDVGCPPCEAHPLRNITTFLKGLTDLLKEENLRNS